MKQNNQTTANFVGKHVFTVDEKEQKLQQMLTAMRVKQEIEDELKTTKSTYKAKIDARDAEIKLISNLLNAGFEDKTFSCLLTKDFEAGKRLYHEIGTNLLVGEEPLTAADYQTKMDLEEAEIKANNEAADKLAVVIEDKVEEAGLHVVSFDEEPEETAPVEPEVINHRPQDTVFIDPNIHNHEDQPFELDEPETNGGDEEEDPFSFDDI